MKKFIKIYFSFILLAISLTSLAQTTTVTITATGAGTWTCPTGVTSVDVQVWGAGGSGGGGGSTNAHGGGGGGGGGYSAATVGVTPGVTYNLTVGAGGAQVANGSNGNPGGNSTITLDGPTVVTANGGAGGLTGNGGTRAGGAGGTGSTSNGGNGGDGNAGDGAGGGGEGACTTGNGADGIGGNNGNVNEGFGGNSCDGGNGGLGRQNNNGAGLAGQNIGGGGGGGTNGATGTGGAGARGEIRITYVDPCQNGVQDAWEAGVDCGGPDCVACTRCNFATDLPCGTYQLAATTVGVTNEASGASCLTSNYGIWFTFVGDGTTNIFWFTPEASYDLEVALFSGSSCGSLTPLGCIDGGLAGEAEGFTLTPTLGTRYYIHVAYWASFGTATDVGTFTVDRSCPDNVTCATADALACGQTLMGSNFGAATAADGTGCTIGDKGNWYTFVGDGQVTTLTAKSVTNYEFEMAVSYGTCGSQTNQSCTDINAGGTESYTFTTVAGRNYFVYIADDDAAGVDEGNFTLLRTCGNSCGNDTTNDYCSDPAILSQGGAGWSSSTTGTYTYDMPANTTSLFCGSIENNSWYQFTASAATEVFNFTNVTNCTLGAGIQAQAFSVTKNGSGCCTNLASVSNCMSNGTTANATVTATGLTIGADYILMVDGFAGDQCDFTVTDWTATGILLPVDLLYFDGQRFGESTKLYWSTSTEVNNDYFIVQKSSNGRNFIDVGTIKGNGNSNVVNNYEFMDNSSSPQIAYYRLKQIDFNGAYAYSKIIAIASKNDPIDIVIYPNPATKNLFVDISSEKQQVFTIKYFNLLGSIASEIITVSSESNTFKLEYFNQLNTGLYILQFYDEQNNLIKSEKIIKQ